MKKSSETQQKSGKTQHRADALLFTNKKLCNRKMLLTI